MVLLAIFFGFSILQIGSDFAAMDGRHAQDLELAGSGIVPFVPIVATVVYGASIVGIKRIQATATRWIVFVLATAAATYPVEYPIDLLKNGSTKISIPEFLSKESVTALEEKYPIKWVSYSSSSEGTCIRVAKEDYSPALAVFVAELTEQQAEQDEDVQSAAVSESKP